MALATLVVTFIGVVGGLVAIAYSGRQLTASRRSNQGSFLLQLDEAFVHHADVHRKLRPGGDWAKDDRGPSNPDEWAMIEAYMGLFERIEILIEDRVVDGRLVNRLYGYRVQNIVSNSKIYQEKLVDRASGWTDFLRLVQRLESFGRMMTYPDTTSPAQPGRSN